jgi:hypothetical protein
LSIIYVARLEQILTETAEDREGAHIKAEGGGAQDIYFTSQK